jgi:hypothetical protein
MGRQTMYTEEPIDKVLQDRAIAILSAMLLHMKHNNMEKMEYKKVIPVKLGREEAERTGNYAEKWEIRVVVRKNE